MRQKVSQLTAEYNNLNLTTENGAKRADELQKELSQLNAELNKGSKAAGSFKDNIGNYPKQLGDAAKGINVAGTSVGDLTTKMSGFINPATAAVGVVTALAGVYARSATGARDLAFATSTLSAATSIASEAFAKMISSGEEGQGIFSTLVNGILFSLSPSLAIAANQMAVVEQQLARLDTARAFAAGFAKEDERRAEILRRIRDDEEKGLEERLEASKKIDAFLESSGVRTTSVIRAQINAIKESTIGYEKNVDAQLKVAQLTAEIADKEEEITGKLTENVTARKAISAEIQALADANRRLQTPNPEDSADPLQGAFQTDIKQAELDATINFNDRIVQAERDKNNQILIDRRHNAEAQAEVQKHLSDAQIMSAIGVTGAIASVLDQQGEAYKAFATAQTIISTYAAAQKAYEAAFVPPTVASPALAAINVGLAIASGLANVAAIHGVQFAEGGYTGAGSKYQPAGIVHAGEVVWSQKDVAAVGGPAAANSMRPTALRGYADGGFVTQQNVSASQQALITANAIKNLPPPVVGVEEITSTQKRIQVRERTARI